jgi:hypothetical protein
MYNNEFHRLCVILYVVFILEIFRMIVSEAQSELSKFAPMIRRNGIHCAGYMPSSIQMCGMQLR